MHCYYTNGTVTGPFDTEDQAQAHADAAGHRYVSVLDFHAVRPVAPARTPAAPRSYAAQFAALGQ